MCKPPSSFHSRTQPYTKLAKMATYTLEAEVFYLDERGKFSNRNAVEASSAKQVFQTVSAALALVRVGFLVPHPTTLSLVDNPIRTRCLMTKIPRNYLNTASMYARC